MKKIVKSKKGFTLLEVMLAVAILVITSTMIMHGYLSTLEYANNTSVYRSYGNANYSEMNDSLYSVAEGNSPLGARSTITLTSGTFNVDLTYVLSGSSDASSINRYGTGYTENRPVSVSREAILYSQPQCPDCHRYDTMRLEEYENPEGEIEYIWFCSDRDGCGYRYLDIIRGS